METLLCLLDYNTFKWGRQDVRTGRTNFSPFKKAGVVLLLILAIDLFSFSQPREVFQLEPKFGFSFSPRQATYLGLGWQETYLALLDGLQPSFIRIPVFWSEVQRDKDGFDFSEVDWMLEEAKKRNVLVTVNLGYTIFRHPECYEPRWAWDLEGQEFDQALVTFLEESVGHLADFANLEAWQVENEKELWIDKSHCRIIKNGLFLKEIETVRRVDGLGRPVVVTHGGKTFIRPLWEKRIRFGDVFAVSLFPKTYNRYLRFYTSNLWFRNISLERVLTEKAGRRFWISEFQAEAWGKTALNKITPEEANKTMNPQILTENLQILENWGGAERVYLWGVEWWYKELLEGRKGMWEAGQSLLERSDGRIEP